AFANDPTKQAQWRAFIRKSRMEANVPEFRQVVQELADFMGPVCGALAAGFAFRGRWLLQEWRDVP
ncbi:MAG TPA: hypothetical protein VF960_01105, partial [Chloroflexota bacterium]